MTEQTPPNGLQEAADRLYNAAWKFRHAINPDEFKDELDAAGKAYAPFRASSVPLNGGPYHPSGGHAEDRPVKGRDTTGRQLVAALLTLTVADHGLDGGNVVGLDALIRASQDYLRGDYK